MYVTNDCFVAAERVQDDRWNAFRRTGTHETQFFNMKVTVQRSDADFLLWNIPLLALPLNTNPSQKVFLLLQLADQASSVVFGVEMKSTSEYMFPQVTLRG